MNKKDNNINRYEVGLPEFRKTVTANHYGSNLQLAATATAIIAGAAIPISTAFQNISIALFLIIFILTPNAWGELKKRFKEPLSLVGLMLGISLFVGLLWSTASSSDAWGFIRKMREYYLIPIFLLLFANRKVRNIFMIGFASATMLSVVLSCLFAWLNHPVLRTTDGDWSIFRSHTYHNYFASLLAIGLFIMILNKKMSLGRNLAAIAALLLLIYNVFFLIDGRSGQISFIVMFITVLLLKNWRVGLIAGIVIIATSIIILPKYSNVIQSGINKAQSDVSAYAQGNSNTSIGLRLEWYENSIKLIREKPFLGHGTGSFKTEHTKIQGPEKALLATRNPHNDYLWLSVELGLFGGFLLLALLLAAAWQGRHLDASWKWALYAMLVGMGTLTLANSFFTDNITGSAFALLVCALLNGPKETILND